MSLNVNIQIELSTLCQSLFQTEVGSEKFQPGLQNQFTLLETSNEFNDITSKLMRIIRDVGYKHFRQRYMAISQLFLETLEQTRQRYEIVNTTTLQEMCRTWHPPTQCKD